MLAPLLLILFLLPGCATPGADAPEPQAWTFTQRIGEEEPQGLGEAAAFDDARELRAAGGFRQIGGQWHGALAADAPIQLRFNASVPMRVAFVVRSAEGASASGTCDWPADSTEEKSVGLGRARMRSTETTCEIVFTPGVAVEGEPTLRWEARSREEQPEGWSLHFLAQR